MVWFVIKFALTDFTILDSVFETTIRYVAGLLSAYELSGEKFPALLQKATEVADKLTFAWVGVSILLTWSFRQNILYMTITLEQRHSLRITELFHQYPRCANGMKPLLLSTLFSCSTPCF